MLAVILASLPTTISGATQGCAAPCPGVRVEPARNLPLVPGEVDILHVSVKEDVPPTERRPVLISAAGGNLPAAQQNVGHHRNVGRETAAPANAERLTNYRENVAGSETGSPSATLQEIESSDQQGCAHNRPLAAQSRRKPRRRESPAPRDNTRSKSRFDR
jgi:hypothetical protein